jgi:hypothetical protein
MNNYSEEENEKFSEMICATPGCYNYPMRGIIYCISCMYGPDQLAPEEAIKWKKHKENNSI